MVDALIVLILYLSKNDALNLIKNAVITDNRGTL